jgi:dolichol-phosphate mannosyltransferase
MTTLSVVVPVDRVESNIQPFIERIVTVPDSLGISYEVIFSMDPSPDRTEEVIL